MSIPSTGTRLKIADASRLRFGIVVSGYHRDLTDRLLEGAFRCFESHQVSREGVSVFWVPGAFEIPQAAARILSSGPEKFNALVCLGVIIRGDTIHFEVLAHSVAGAVSETAMRALVPVTLGILTVETEEQAWKRSAEDSSNKGWEATEAALQMATLYRDLEEKEG